ncbi:uncharacterized protein LOC123688891 [Harmonia axyridis]|uniref:uncharacterized protein LOC123688891 n=1 Tax=Harmonia axyridis TaxID=115357 RepID=UPI001E278FE6|nr:uncharacterized protein LOC123688891 [Harmonia axyridis]
MSCIGECLDLGPPPDSILFLPPPPAPSILQHSLPDLLLNTTPCSAGQLCDAWVPLNKFPDSEDYVELSRKEAETWSTLDDTWLLVLIVSSIGVLLLGALLAMFLLKCREMNMFGSNDCSLHSREPRPMKILEQRECTSSNGINGSKMIHPNDPTMYNGNVGLQDNRMVWAALTPGGGTQHFISENYPKEFVDYREADDHYETIDNITIKPAVAPNVYHSYHKGMPYHTNERSSFDNSNYEYEEPMPLIKSYQYNSFDDYQYTLPGGNTDMRCISMAYASNSMRRHMPVSRPRVSSPTRIEHPNLPPLNLYPLKSSTLKRNSNLSYRNVDTGTLPKYTC